MKIFSAQLKGTTTVATGSNVSLTGSFSGSIAGIDINSTNTFTGSTSNRLNSIETISASNVSRLNSLESFSSSVYTTNTFTASASERLNALEVTSASVDTLNTNQNTRLNNLENKTGSLATTGSNTFYGTQVFSGSVYIKENLIVQGSSSLQNITASAVDIGTNKIILNVNNPAVRFAGISVYDSGSTQGTGSLWWDSTQNHWLYEHPSDSAAPYNSAILISGPKNTGNLGEETELVSNFVMKAVGGDHISSSAIYDDGTTVSLKSNTEVSGTFKHNASTASFAGVVGIGRTAPEFTLDVNGDIALNRTNKLMFAGGVVGDRARSYITGDGNNNLYVYGPSNNIITTFTYTSGVGIGITNPSTTFNVSHPSHGVGISYMGSSSLPAIAGLYTGDGTLGGSGYGDLYIKARTDYGGYYNIMLHTAASNNTSVERMRITHSGLVGIGTTNPGFQLHVSSSADALFVGANGASQTAQFKNSSANPVILRLMNNNGNFYDIQNNPSDNSFTIDYADTEKLRIMNGGYVGIGNSNPQAKLDLGTTYSGGTYRNAFFLYNDNNSGPYYGTKNGFYMDQFGLSNNTTVSFSTATGAPGTLYFASKNTDVNDSSSLTPRMVIAGQTGNVGIGITNSSHKLQIQGNLNLSGLGLMRTYFAQSYSLGSQFEIFRFLNDNGSVFAQSGISGLLFLNAQDTNTGGNQISYTFHLQTNGNGTAQANLTQMSYQLRGTQPIQSIGLQNDGGGGAVKVVGSVVGSGVGGCNVWATFVGVAV